MRKVQKMFKKVISMIVAVCLMIGIANIPVYAAPSNISVRTTDAVLGKPYMSVSDAQKSAEKEEKKTNEGQVTTGTKKTGDKELTEILTNFGVAAAGYTYHSFPKYDAANNAYTLISTGKNNYKLEISVSVGKGNNAKEEAKKEAEKIGTALLWGKSAGEIQEVLKNAKVVVKQNDKTVANFNSLNKNANVNSLAIDKTSVKEANFNNIKVNPVLDATTVAKETVKNVLGVSETSNKLKSSIDQTVISKYTEAGYNAIKSFANYLGLSLQTAYDKFIKMGVTKEQMEKAASGLNSLIQRGVSFFVCSTFALSKYLGISQP